MLLGPIVYVEMIKTARQGRWYVLRVLLGLGLFFVIYQNLQWSNFSRRQSISDSEFHQTLMFASMKLFYYLIIGQSAVIIFLTPALTAGTIAEEKQRKTLHYLLASELTSFEIVIGKLASRLLLIALPIAISLPVMVMLSLFGGVDLNLVVASYVAFATTALFEGSLAILISTLVRRGREALLLTFLIVLAWLFVPVMLEELMTNYDKPWPEIYRRWIEPVNRHLIDLGPFCLKIGQSTGLGGPKAFSRMLLSMVGHQLLASAFLLILATWQVRPAFRRQEGDRIFGKGITGRVHAKMHKWRPRRPCGDDAMRWKETHEISGSALLSVISYLTILSVAACAFDALKYTVPHAWSALRSNGYNVGADLSRQELNVLLRAMNTGIFCILGLVLASLAATSVSREREEDTWVSLISTPLDGSSIMTSKLVGSLWAVRPLFIMIGCIWVFGLLMGAFHPLGVALSVSHLIIFTLFILCLGSLISLSSRTTTKAVGLTFCILLILSLGVPILAEILGIRNMKGLVTCIPAQFAMGMLSYRDVGTAITGTLPLINPDREKMFLYDLTSMLVVGALSYLIVGGFMLTLIYRMFDQFLDRPRRGYHPDQFNAQNSSMAVPKGVVPIEIPASHV